MADARSPVHVKRQIRVGDNQFSNTNIEAWFPITQDGILTAISELDCAYTEAREQLAGMISEGTHE